MLNKHSDIFFYNLKINSSNQAFLKAFVFGDKSELYERTKKHFQKFGNYASLRSKWATCWLSLFCYIFLFKCLDIKYNYRIVCTMIVLFGYLYLVDFSVSSTRAYIMLLMWSLSKLVGIKPVSYNLVGVQQV